jgi:hypothetical protein
MTCYQQRDKVMLSRESPSDHNCSFLREYSRRLSYDGRLRQHGIPPFRKNRERWAALGAAGGFAPHRTQPTATGFLFSKFLACSNANAICRTLQSA